MLPDEEKISSILEKNTKVRQLIEGGHTLSLVFAREREGRKMAVLKLSPEVRSVVVANGNRIFLGLSSCRTYDRFWANQCRHCQKFYHTAVRRPKKNAPQCAASVLAVTCQLAAQISPT